MTDLLAFLTAVHDADEQAARAAMALDTGQWIAEEAMAVLPDRVSALLPDGRTTTHVAEVTNDRTTAHIARHDPQSVLARVEAERALAAMHPPMYAPRGYAECEGCSPEHGAFGMADSVEWPCPTLRALAWGYRHREGWRAEWAPDGVEVGA